VPPSSAGNEAFSAAQGAPRKIAVTKLPLASVSNSQHRTWIFEGELKSRGK